jgi:hypothetical protein
MQKLSAIITVGLPASGKSSWAQSFVNKNNGYTIIERDKLRLVILKRLRKVPQNETDLDFKKWNYKLESWVEVLMNKYILSAKHKHKNIIMSDMNINPIYLESSVDKLKMGGYEDIEIKKFSVDIDESIERDSKRKYPLGENIIRKIFESANI